MTRPWVLGVLGAAAAAGLGSAACARPFPPPGGERPDVPPAVISVVPEPLSVQRALTGPVVFRFDRRISERLAADPVIVSPATSPVRVQRSRSEIRVSLAEGWQPDQIYRVVLLPGVSDLFNNVTTQPIELVFSTGPAIPATAVAGLVTDRLTGRPAANSIVEAVRQPDSVAYVVPTDTGGFFSLRYLPQGDYETRAWADQNRNRRLDPSESVSPVMSVRLASPSDTVPLLLAVLPPDTTPARLLRAEALDSLRVQLAFDDYFVPDADLDGARVALIVVADSTAGPSGRLVTAAQAEALRAAETAAAAAADTAAATPPPPAQTGTPAPAEPLPARELVFLLQSPLRPETEYEVTVSGVRNISGIPGGGGNARFTSPAPAPPPGPPPPDTTRAQALRATHSARVRGDSSHFPDRQRLESGAAPGLTLPGARNTVFLRNTRRP